MHKKLGPLSKFSFFGFPKCSKSLEYVLLLLKANRNVFFKNALFLDFTELLTTLKNWRQSLLSTFQYIHKKVMDYKSLKYLDLLLLAYRNGKKIWQMHLQSYFKKYYIIHKNDHEIFKKKTLYA